MSIVFARISCGITRHLIQDHVEQLRRQPAEQAAADVSLAAGHDGPGRAALVRARPELQAVREAPGFSGPPLLHHYRHRLDIGEIIGF